MSGQWGISDRLAQILVTRRIGIGDVAKASGMDVRVLRDKIAGKRPWTTPDLSQLAIVLDVPVHWLFAAPPASQRIRKASHKNRANSQKQQEQTKEVVSK